MSSVVVGSCEVCGRQRFPKPIWCASCGSNQIRDTTVDTGVVEETTTIRHIAGRTLPTPVRIGSVRTRGGAIVIARLESGAGEGDEVELRAACGAAIAHAST